MDSKSDSGAMAEDKLSKGKNGASMEIHKKKFIGRMKKSKGKLFLLLIKFIF